MHLPTSGHGQASHWRLVALFTRQTLVDPHHGSLLGVAWLLLLPLVHILIYTLVFSEFMGARLGASNNAYAYSLYLVPGLLLWGRVCQHGEQHGQRLYR